MCRSLRCLIFILCNDLVNAVRHGEALADASDPCKKYGATSVKNRWFQWTRKCQCPWFFPTASQSCGAKNGESTFLLKNVNPNGCKCEDPCEKYEARSLEMGLCKCSMDHPVPTPGCSATSARTGVIFQLKDVTANVSVFSMPPKNDPFR